MATMSPAASARLIFLSWNEMRNAQTLNQAMNLALGGNDVCPAAPAITNLMHSV